MSIPLGIQEEWATLKEKILFYDKAYYQDNTSLISDEAYDLLSTRLICMEEAYPELAVDSPSQTVGSHPHETFPIVQHLSPLYSLDNLFNKTQLDAFLQKTHRFLSISDPLTWVAEPKIDGLTVIIRYEKGHLIHAATRGDGLQGEDITENLKTISSIPKSLNDPCLPTLFEIRGEVFIQDSDFFLLNQQRQKEGLAPFANARNAAAGSLRQLDASITACRSLSYITHGFSHPLGKTYTEMLLYLSALGFPIQPLMQLCHDPTDMQHYFMKIQEQRHHIGYALDGVVFKVDRLDLQERLGHSSRAPRYAVAYKFSAPQGTTVIEKIEVQVGRMGTLTPVAHMAPVVVGGVTITRASLHNEEEIIRKDIRTGDTVIIERAGDVIPHIVGILKKYRTTESYAYVFPTQCPVCQGPAIRPDGYAARRCASLICPAQIIWRLRHFVSRKAFDIEGVGLSHLKTLYERDFLKTAVDFFTLSAHQDALKALDGWGKKSVQNLLSAIHTKKNIDLAKFLYALGIPQIGETTARLLASSYETINAFQKEMDLCIQNDSDALSFLESIEGLGPIMIQELLNFTKTNASFIADLLQHITVLPFVRSLSDPSSFFSRKIIVFTGTLQHMTRAEAKQWAHTLGAKVSQMISSQTDYVILGDKAGSKKETALQLGIPLLTEEQWMAHLPISIESTQ